MDAIAMARTRSHNRRTLVIVGCIVALLAALLVVSGPVSKADATVESFCNGYTAAKYGQPGDRCANPNFHTLNGVTGKGVQHSACVDALNGSGALITSWACSSGANVEVSLGTCCGQWLRGIVRNNTTGATNNLWGWDSF